MKLKMDKFEQELSKKDTLINQQAEDLEHLTHEYDELQQESIETVDELKTEICNIKESNQSMIQLYEYQNDAFKGRVTKEIEHWQSLSSNSDLREDSNSYSTLLNDLAQRDAVCRTLKEENKELKLQVATLKTKSKEIKLQKIREVAKIPDHIKNPKQASKISKKVSEVNKFPNDEEDYSLKDYHQILKRISLVEAENIKLTSKSLLINL